MRNQSNGFVYFSEAPEGSFYFVALQVDLNTNTPTINSAATVSVNENTSAGTVVYTITAYDADMLGSQLIYAIGGTDAGLFNIESSSGRITFRNSPNYEAPGDFGGDNVYNITVTASDGTNTSTAQAVAITVTNVAPTAVFSAATDDVGLVTGNLKAVTPFDVFISDVVATTIAKLQQQTLTTAQRDLAVAQLTIVADSVKQNERDNGTAGEVFSSISAALPDSTRSQWSFADFSSQFGASAQSASIDLLGKVERHVGVTTSDTFNSALAKLSASMNQMKIADVDALINSLYPLVTNDTSLLLSGTNIAGSTVKVYNGSVELGAATVIGTAWSYSASVANGTTYAFNIKETDAAGEVGAATSNFTITGDTTASTVTASRVAYLAYRDTLVITGTNFDTLLSGSENSSTNIKARLDWTKLVWDTDGDGTTTPNQTFALADISTVKVTDSTHLSITLGASKASTLEGLGSFSAATPIDKVNIGVGFAKDLAGNVSTTDALSQADVRFAPGDAVIDLGSHGLLINPVQVDNGKWYYYWDRSGDGTSASTGSLNGGLDTVTHDELDALFTQDISGNVRPAPSLDTSDVHRYATINGVTLALPSLGDTYAAASKPGTSVGNATAANGSTADNPTYNDLLAVWDAYNGTGTSATVPGVPPGWGGGNYWSASDTGTSTEHSYLDLLSGAVNTASQTTPYYVAFQVL